MDGEVTDRQREVTRQHLDWAAGAMARILAAAEEGRAQRSREIACEAFFGKPIPEGSMRVAPGSDALVWRTAPEHSGEL